MTHDELASLIVDKLLEKYTIDEIKEMSTIDLEAAFITTICDLALENYMVERPRGSRYCAPLVSSAFKMALDETDQQS